MRILIWGLILVVSAMAYNKVKYINSLPQEIIEKEALLLDYDMEKIYALEYLNELREAVGLVPFSTSALLEKSAQNHAHYIIENNEPSHYENVNKLAYTGESIGDRVKAVGYKSSFASENLSTGSRDYKHSIDGLFSAIYHRFGFLDFKIDEIGMGIEQNSLKKSKTAFVYNMGNSRLNRLCNGKSFYGEGSYIEGACFDRDFKIKYESFKEALSNRKHATKIAIYPYDGQVDVPPAFFEETPDPLPDYEVSGFPISISFDEEQYKKLELISFKLFDSEGKEVKDTIFYNHDSDINHMFKKFEFALFPLKRLKWNSRYKVEVNYFADGEKKQKKWSFTTRTFEEKLHIVTASNYKFKIKKNISEIFYFKPFSEHDSIKNIEYPLSVDVSIIDNNTIRFTAFEDASSKVILNFGKHKLILDIE
jgi:hypothetical protein